jgi:hypothetical protein
MPDVHGPYDRSVDRTDPGVPRDRTSPCLAPHESIEKVSSGSTHGDRRNAPRPSQDHVHVQIMHIGFIFRIVIEVGCMEPGKGAPIVDPGATIRASYRTQVARPLAGAMRPNDD